MSEKGHLQDDKIRGCLWGILIGDALAMPVHWFYNPEDIVSNFGEVTKYEAPQEKPHPHGFMSPEGTLGTLPHTRPDGTEASVIGSIINQDKKEFWVKGVHYHRGMQPGENTLDALLTRLAMRAITRTGGNYDPTEWLKDFSAFLTTPGTHTDTFADTFIREFFLNFSLGKPVQECSTPIPDGHDHAMLGTLSTYAPVLLSAVAKGRSEALTAGVTHLKTISHSSDLFKWADRFGGLLLDVLSGASLESALSTADLMAQQDPSRDDIETVYKVFHPSCALKTGMPASSHFLLKYGDDIEAALLANVNAGGDNCGRSMPIGAVLGAKVGESGIPKHLKEGLHAYAEIKAEIDAFMHALESS